MMQIWRPDPTPFYHLLLLDLHAHFLTVFLQANKSRLNKNPSSYVMLGCFLVMMRYTPVTSQV